MLGDLNDQYNQAIDQRKSMIQQILAEPDWENRLEMEDLRALTPLIYAHVNPYGRFHLDLDERLPLDD